MDDTNPTLTPLSLSVDNGKIFLFSQDKGSTFSYWEGQDQRLTWAKVPDRLVKNTKYNLNRQGLYYYEEIDENSLAQV